MTGRTGYIGRPFIKALLEKGAARIVDVPESRRAAH